MSSMHIIHQGEDSYKRTDDFLKKEKEIRQQIDLEYKILIGTEKNILRRIKLWIRKQTLLHKTLSKLNSKDVLFLVQTSK